MGITECRLADTVRRGKVSPEIILGRRAWFPKDVLQFAELHGLDTPKIRDLRKLVDSVQAKEFFKSTVEEKEGEE